MGEGRNAGQMENEQMVLEGFEQRIADLESRLSEVEKRLEGQERRARRGPPSSGNFRRPKSKS